MFYLCTQFLQLWPCSSRCQNLYGFIYLLQTNSVSTIFSMCRDDMSVACLALLTYQFGFYQTDSWHIAKSLTNKIVGLFTYVFEIKSCLDSILQSKQIVRHTIDLFTLVPQLFIYLLDPFLCEWGCKKININSFTNDKAIEILQIRIITNTRGTCICNYCMIYGASIGSFITQKTFVRKHIVWIVLTFQFNASYNKLSILKHTPSGNTIKKFSKLEKKRKLGIIAENEKNYKC